jgi:putative tryptophan/tyrosine transport system substrate-binding protein
MMNRRTFLSTMSFLFAAPLVARAQSAGKLPRIGWLGNTAPPPPPVNQLDGFIEGLREAGYVEGKNVIIEYRWAAGRMDRLPELARELADRKVDVFMVGGEPGLEAAKRVGTIPVVDVACDPVETMQISLARPGGGATGVTCVSSELAPKRLQFLKEVLPGLTRVAVLYNPTDPHKGTEASLLEAVAKGMGLAIVHSRVGAAGEFESAFAVLSRARTQAIMILADPFMNFQRKVIAGLAARDHLPTMYGFRESVDDGGLMSYGANIRNEFRRAAGYVAKILKGAKPGDLPIEQPTKFELVINMKTAKTLGLTIPPSLLLRADQVIE